ncbi:MAG: bifunctional folylpolyglutamate synthase/dihydrofolate synthase [Thermodesulfobacteriota bacterium]
MSRQYKETIDYLYSLTGLGIRPGLQSIKGLLKLLGNPERNLPALHIAGTNGKGSTAAMIESVMREAGYSVGLYTSPHLTRFNERICIGGEFISDEDIVRIAAVVMEARGRLKDEKALEATFFEVATAMALLYFREKKVDMAVMETGLGGRLDATNIVRPLVSVITNVAMDHSAFLGSKVADIAAEKAGIIKENVPVVCGELGYDSASVISSRAVEVAGKEPIRLGHEFSCKVTTRGRFNYSGLKTSIKGLEPGLSGAFQLKNGALALAALELLSESYPRINEEAMREGLRRVKWPGRFELLSETPPVILDCAHNEAGAHALAGALREYFSLPLTMTLVTGISEDKDINGILARLLPLSRRVILTEAGLSRAAPLTHLQKAAAAIRGDCEAEPTVNRAIVSALKGLGQGEVLVIAGSIYVACEAREFFSAASAATQATG